MEERIIVDINPTIFQLFGLEVRWYGLMYVIAFILAGLLMRYLIKVKYIKMPLDRVDTMLTYMLIGMFLGARLAYVFIYNWAYYQNNFSEILAVWRGGLSFHGGLAGAILGGYLFSLRQKIPWIRVMDAAALCAAPGLFFGRIGNFINGELYGRATDHWVGMIFPHGGPFPRHPSQLYEAFFEGLVLTLILWAMRPYQKFAGLTSAAFVFGYGFFRYFIEFFREPDPQLGLFFGGTTSMGQILCLLMMAFGIGLYFYYQRKGITH